MIEEKGLLQSLNAVQSRLCLLCGMQSGGVLSVDAALVPVLLSFVSKNDKLLVAPLYVIAYGHHAALFFKSVYQRIDRSVGQACGLHDQWNASCTPQQRIQYLVGLHSPLFARPHFSRLHVVHPLISRK